MRRRSRSEPSPEAPWQRAVACLVLAVYALLAVAGVAIVQCHEADGTVAIEWRGADCCATTPSGAPADEGPSVGGGCTAQDCAGCTDVALDGLIESSRPSQRADAPLPDAAATVAALAAPVRLALPAIHPARAGSRPPPAAPPPLAALRTVRLRV